MNILAVLPLIIIITVSRIVVLIGAVLLKMTGLDDEAAKFQALSAFTGTGFTTKETELIMRDRRRRKIISNLIILGNVGMASTISGIFLSFIKGNIIQVSIKILIIIIFLLIIFYLFTPALQRRIMKSVENYLRKKQGIKSVKIENILNFAEGYKVSELRVFQNFPCVGKSLQESRLREQGILVLAIERPGEFIPAPNADTVINEGDILICYGNIDSLKKITS